MKTAADLPIVKACPLEGELPGEGAARHCSACNEVVVDLSLLTANDADALMRSAARPACVAYLVDAHGAVVHLPQPPPVPARRRLPLFAGALLLAACQGAAPVGDVTPTDTTSAPVVTTSVAAAPVALRGEVEPPAGSPEGCELGSKVAPSPAPSPAASPSAAAAAPLKITRPVPPPVRLRGKPARIGDPF